MGSTVWKGHLTFGLVAAPVKMQCAARENKIEFNGLHRGITADGVLKPCHLPVNQKKVCKTCNVDLEATDIIKGFKVSKDRYVVVDEAKLEALKTVDSSKQISVLKFVPATEIDPVYFDSSYYILPDGVAGDKAYDLMTAVMKGKNYVGIVKITLNQREQMAFIRVCGPGLTLHTMFYAGEVRALPEYDGRHKAEVNPQELAMATALFETMVGGFNPTEYQDEYDLKVRAMLDEACKEQHETTTPQSPVDPIAAIKTMLDNIDARKAAEAAAEKKPTEKPIEKPPVAKKKTRTGAAVHA